MAFENVIHKVLNSSRKLSERNIKRLDLYCKKAYITQLKGFKFWPMNDSKHRCWSHCARKIRLLYGRSLGLISENALERSVRKIIKTRPQLMHMLSSENCPAIYIYQKNL